MSEFISPGHFESQENSETEPKEITGYEAQDLIAELSDKGLCLTHESLGGRSLRLTRKDIREIDASDARIEYLSKSWRQQYLETGIAISQVALDTVAGKFILITPAELGSETEYNLAKMVEDFWRQRQILDRAQDSVAARRQLLAEMEETTKGRP